MKLMITDTLRTIKSNFARFCAVAGVIALGVGFYAALLMTSNDMKISLTEYFNNTNFMDICVVSTQGMTENDIRSYKEIDGVEGVMPTRETDALASLGDTSGVVRIQSLSESAYNSEVINENKVVSDDKNYISRPVLLEGSWPKNPDECVVGTEALGAVKLKIGDTIRLQSTIYDINSTMSVKEFKVTGLVNSSTYVCTSALGHTSLGDGMINQYMFIPFSSFSDNYPITDCYIKVEGSDQYLTGSPEYQHLVDKVMAKIAELHPGLTDIRSASSSSYAEDLYNQAMAELQAQKDAVNQELASNEEKLIDTYIELEGGAWQIELAEQQISAAYEEFNQRRIDAQRQFEEARAQLDRQVNLVNQVVGSIESNYSEIDASRVIIADGWSDQVLPNLQSLDAKLATTMSRCDSSITYLCSIVSDPESQDQIKMWYNQYKRYAGDLKTYSASFAEDLANPLTVGAVVYLAEIGEWGDIYTNFAKTHGVIEQNLNPEIIKALNEGYDEIARKEAEVNAQIEQARRDLDAAANELREKARQADIGREEYLAALEQFNNAKNTAFAEIDAAEAKINSGLDGLSGLPPLGYYILDRSKNYGSINFLNDADRISAVAQVFPLIFFIVVAIVALTCMSRMTEEERRTLAIYKSLGYSKFKSVFKLYLYALIAVVVGSFFGLLILTQAIPTAAMVSYTIMYHVPYSVPMPFDMPIAILSELIGLVIIFGATFIVSWKFVRRPLAELISVREKRVGKKILLERITPLWKLFTLKFRIALRNAFGYKKTLVMSLVGIASCAALLFAGFGMHDSINGILVKQFGNVMHDNYSVNFKDNLSEEQKSDVESKILKADKNAKIVYSFNYNVVALPEGRPDANVNIIAPQDIDEFNTMRALQNRETKETYKLEDDGALITEKLASIMNLNVGDTISVYKQDQVGNASTLRWDFKISGIVENYVAHYIYASPDYIRQVMNHDPLPNSLICKVNINDANMTKFNNSITSLSYVKTAGFNNDSQDSYWEMVDSVDTLVALTVLFAVALLIVILANLSRVIATERRREISLLKASTLTFKALYRYFNKEMIILCVLGSIIGVFAGIWLEGILFASAEFDYCMFARDIYPLSIILTIVITTVLSVVISLLGRNIFKSVATTDYVGASE